MADELIHTETVAEGLWQTDNGIDGNGLEAHKAWQALPEAEKQQWRLKAEIAIPAWKKAKGYE